MIQVVTLEGVFAVEPWIWQSHVNLVACRGCAPDFMHLPSRLGEPHELVFL